MQARRQRFEAHLAATRESSERSLAEKKGKRELNEKRMAADEDARRKLAAQTSNKYQAEDDVRQLRQYFGPFSTDLFSSIPPHTPCATLYFARMRLQHGLIDACKPML